MSESAPVQPTAPAPVSNPGQPTAAPPMKIPVKVAGILNKIPMKAPMLPGKAVQIPSSLGPLVKVPVNPPPRPAGSAPPATGVKPTSVAVKPTAAQPAAAKAPAAAKPPAPKPKPSTLVRSNIRDEDEDDEQLLGKKKIAAAPAPVAAPVRRRSPPKVVKRTRAPSPSESRSSSGSDDDDDDDSSDEDVESEEEVPSDPDDVPLFMRAKQSGLVPEDISQILAEDEEVKPTGPPPRPKPFPFPTGSLEAALDRAKIVLERTEADARIKDNNKTISLGTSKTNYIDPRIVWAWTKKYNVAISRVLNKSLQDKFPWAKEVSADFKF